MKEYSDYLDRNPAPSSSCQDLISKKVCSPNGRSLLRSGPAFAPFSSPFFWWRLGWRWAVRDLAENGPPHRAHNPEPWSMGRGARRITDSSTRMSSGVITSAGPDHRRDPGQRGPRLPEETSRWTVVVHELADPDLATRLSPSRSPWTPIPRFPVARCHGADHGRGRRQDGPGASRPLVTSDHPRDLRPGDSGLDRKAAELVGELLRPRDKRAMDE